MATYNEGILKKTQRGLSILAFETSKQSRILKKRMRVAALQKEIKADLRDLGNLVYNAIVNHQSGILEEEEVKILVENIRTNKAEVERIRDSIGRLGRAKKHFTDEEIDFFREGPRPDEQPGVVVESVPPSPDPSVDVTAEASVEGEAAAAQPTSDEAKSRQRAGKSSSDFEPDTPLP